MSSYSIANVILIGHTKDLSCSLGVDLIGKK